MKSYYSSSLFITIAIIQCLSTNFQCRAQSVNYRAQGHYYSAKENYQNKRFSEALQYIYKCKEALKGTNQELQYLHILSAYYANDNEEAQKEMEVYFQLEEEKIKTVRFDKTVDRLTSDEVKELTKLINKVDEAVEADKALAESEKAKNAAALAAKNSRLNALREKGRKINEIHSGGLAIGATREQFIDYIDQRARSYSSQNQDVINYQRNYKINFDSDSNFDESYASSFPSNVSENGSKKERIGYYAIKSFLEYLYTPEEKIIALAHYKPSSAVLSAVIFKNGKIVQIKYRLFFSQWINLGLPQVVLESTIGKADEINDFNDYIVTHKTILYKDEFGDTILYVWAGYSKKADRTPENQMMTMIFN